MNAMSPNSGHTAKHRSAQIAKATSYVRKTLSEMPESVITLCEVNKNEELWGSKKGKRERDRRNEKIG